MSPQVNRNNGFSAISGHPFRCECFASPRATMWQDSQAVPFAKNEIRRLLGRKLVGYKSLRKLFGLLVSNKVFKGLLVPNDIRDLID